MAVRKDAGTVLVVERAKGPVFFAKFRDSNGKQRKPAIGPAWVVPEGDRRASGRSNAGKVGTWVDRRGEPEDDALTVRQAWERMRALRDEHEDRLREEERRAQEERERGVTVRDAVESWLAWGMRDDPEHDHEAWKHSTSRNFMHYGRRMIRELGDFNIDEVTPEQLEAFLRNLRPERNGEAIADVPSRRLRATYVGIVRGVFRHAARRGWIADDPAARLKAGKRRQNRAGDPLRRDHYLTPDEVRAVVDEALNGDPDAPRRSLADVAAKRRQGQQDAAMILTAAMAGLRAGEVAALRWHNVDLDRSAIHVVQSRTLGETGTPKAGIGRTVPLAPEVAQALATVGLRGHATGQRDLVFVGRGGGHVDMDAFRDRLYEAEDRAGITPRRTVHMLRHTFAVVCASHGVPLRALQQWMGHERMETTEIYAAFMPREQDAAIVSAAFAVPS